MGSMIEVVGGCMSQSTFEPAYFQRGPLVVPHWAKVLADMRLLLTAIGSLGILVEGKSPMPPQSSSWITTRSFLTIAMMHEMILLVFMYDSLFCFYV